VCNVCSANSKHIHIYPCIKLVNFAQDNFGGIIDGVKPKIFEGFNFTGLEWSKKSSQCVLEYIISFSVNGKTSSYNWIKRH